MMPRGCVLVKPDIEMTWNSNFAADGVLLTLKNCKL